MPKMKTNRSAAKRFKLTGTGKARRGHSGLRHGMIGKSRSRKRRPMRLCQSGTARDIGFPYRVGGIFQVPFIRYPRIVST